MSAFHLHAECNAVADAATNETLKAGDPTHCHHYYPHHCHTRPFFDLATSNFML